MHYDHRRIDNWSGIREGDRVRLRNGKTGTAIQQRWYDEEDDRYPIPYWTIQLDNGTTVDVKTKHLTKEVNK
mgnify:FL=1